MMAHIVWLEDVQVLGIASICVDPVDHIRNEASLDVLVTIGVHLFFAAPNGYIAAILDGHPIELCSGEVGVVENSAAVELKFKELTLKIVWPKPIYLSLSYKNTHSL